MKKCFLSVGRLNQDIDSASEGSPRHGGGLNAPPGLGVGPQHQMARESSYENQQQRGHAGSSAML